MVNFIPKKPEKEIISLRISLALLREVDQKAQKSGISRNEFIIQSIQFALANMQDEEEK